MDYHAAKKLQAELNRVEVQIKSQESPKNARKQVKNNTKSKSIADMYFAISFFKR